MMFCLLLDGGGGIQNDIGPSHMGGTTRNSWFLCLLKISCFCLLSEICCFFKKDLSSIVKLHIYLSKKIIKIIQKDVVWWSFTCSICETTADGAVELYWTPECNSVCSDKADLTAHYLNTMRITYTTLCILTITAKLYISPQILNLIRRNHPVDLHDPNSASSHFVLIF